METNKGKITHFIASSGTGSTISGVTKEKNQALKLLVSMLMAQY